MRQEKGSYRGPEYPPLPPPSKGFEACLILYGVCKGSRLRVHSKGPWNYPHRDGGESAPLLCGQLMPPGFVGGKRMPVLIGSAVTMLQPMLAQAVDPNVCHRFCFK